jgi:hypothetical protein
MEPARKICVVDGSLQAITECTADMKQPPQFLLEWIFSYLSLTNVLILSLVSKYWHCATIHMLHTRNSLDLQFKALTPNILVFLVGLAQHVTCLRKLSISGEQWEEKHAGVLGLLLLKNQQLREIEFTGSLHHSILREIVKYCENLERLWKTDTTETEKSETDATEKTKGGVPVDGWLLASLLSGCPHLAQLRIGGVRYTRAPPPTPPESFQLLTHSDIQVLEIENIGLSGVNGTTSRFTKCSFPRLKALCVSEHCDAESGGFLPFSDMLNIIDQSHQLERLKISAQFTFTPADCEHIVRCVPKLQCFQLKPYTSSFVHHMEPRLTDIALDILLKGLDCLESLSIESIGWEEHWDNYHELQEPFLLLQHPFPSLSIFASNITRFQHLKSCVLFGEVTNTFVHALLGVCPSLVRLELYFLGKHTDVDDTMFSIVTPNSPYTSLEILHLHGWKHPTQAPTNVLTSGVLQDLAKKFPNLQKLAVLGLKETDSEVCKMIAVEATHVKHLVIGPILNTTSELLSVVGCLQTLQRLDLCWDKGSLPSSDEEFDIALGTNTLWNIIKKINANVRVRDVGGAGHFYPL